MDQSKSPPQPGAQARAWLATAVQEARAGLAEGGIPSAPPSTAPDGTLLGRGHNRRVQDGDPSTHARDGRVPRGGAAADVSRYDHGDDAVAVLVLLRPGTAVRDLPGRGSGRRPPSTAGTTGSPNTAWRSSVLDDPECVVADARLHQGTTRLCGTRTSVTSVTSASRPRIPTYRSAPLARRRPRGPRRHRPHRRRGAPEAPVSFWSPAMGSIRPSARVSARPLGPSSCCPSRPSRRTR